MNLKIVRKRTTENLVLKPPNKMSNLLSGLRGMARFRRPSSFCSVGFEPNGTVQLV